MVQTTRKGTRWAKKVDDWLQSLGFTTSRRDWMDAGDDIEAELGGLWLSVEAKNHQAHDFAGWLKQAQKNAGVDRIPVVIAHRRGQAHPAGAYVVLSGAAFADLVKKARGW